MRLRQLIVALAFATTAATALGFIAGQPIQADPPQRDPRFCADCCHTLARQGLEEMGPCIRSCHQAEGTCGREVPPSAARP